MSDVNRPSASEQSRADQIAAQAKKRSPVQKNKSLQAGMQSTAQQPMAKKAQSAFDQVMEKTSESSMQNPLPVETGFESHLVQVQEHDDSGSQSFSEEGKDDSDDNRVKEDHKKGDNTSETKGATKVRVQGKAGLKSQSQGSGSGKQEQQQKPQTQSKADGVKEVANFRPKKTEEPVAPTAPQTGWAPGVVQVAEAQAADAPKSLPKALLDQIVQSVTILRRKDLDPEMIIDFHDSMFNGLKLKVSGKDQAVRIEFIVPNRAVEETFRQEKDEIAAALGNKGIEVHSMEIRLS